MVSKYKELIGKRFGPLVILNVVKVNHNGRIDNWLECKCDCGTIKNKRYTNVLRAKYCQNGCPYSTKRLNLIGKKFGKLTVLKFLGNAKWNTTQWECLCDCGKIKITYTSMLTKNTITSCGCSIKKLPEGEAAFNIVYRAYQLGEPCRGYEFDLTKEQFREITQKNCYLCNRSPSTKKIIKSGYYIYNGIDRVDNNKGCVFENSRPCCQVCNIMKSTKSEEDFLNHIKNIYEFRELNK